MTELLVTMVVMALVGTILARTILSNSRFASHQDALMEARESARAAMHIMNNELPMVTDGGLRGAAPDSVTLRVPYAFGMTCQVRGDTLVASLMPTDSAVYASAVPGGLAWRNASGGYTARDNVTVVGSTNSGACIQDSVRLIPGGRRIGVRNVPIPPPPGSILYLYQTITYRYRPSAQFAGRTGLWRKVGSAAYEEVAAPFDTDAGFRFLLGPQLEPSDTAPSNLNAVRGLELRIIGTSVTVPRGSSEPVSFDLSTRIAFHNKN